HTVGGSVKFSSSVHQQSDFLSVEAGGSVTLHCFYKDDGTAWLYWYKQTLGQKPRLVSTFFVYDERGTFYHEFKNNPRFTLETKNGRNHLTISNLRTSDSATYYCARDYSLILEFFEGTTVSVKGSVITADSSVSGFTDEVDSLVLVYFLSGALTFSTILVVLLAFSVYKMNKRNSHHSPGTVTKTLCVSLCPLNMSCEVKSLFLSTIRLSRKIYCSLLNKCRSKTCLSVIAQHLFIFLSGSIL
uniref:Ig-like domain-containing protein n=1 Tax=Lates calcarifer TaxID=8187 RepID=A0A4W6DHB6_LATCA